ncbi:ABC protein, subfamily ABCB/MDR [Anopheles sinensis]|uniref:ABC protein, subfamily ABCB/MDR n=1 Tax=Anopheles sinensis TaxID=74873 RepID=A0A084VL78_ANOSI|nr:ABC protein, subfamily ABCB/MDR [Anopheles sinensis]
MVHGIATRVSEQASSDKLTGRLRAMSYIWSTVGWADQFRPDVGRRLLRNTRSKRES